MGETPGGFHTPGGDDSKAEPYDAYIFHENQKKYLFKQELGRGAQGIVYLYEEENDPSKKLALKVARVGNRYSISAINNEGNFHKKISNIVGLNNYVPKFLGQTYFDKNLPVIKSEYIAQSIEEHAIMIHDTKSSLGIVGLILQMYDAIHKLHSEAKLVHKDIKPDNFRIQDGQVKMIDFGIVAEYQDQSGAHYQQYETPFQGTPVTGSIAAMKGFNHSRRDDLESLAYAFMYLIDFTKVPWVNDTDQPSILLKKREFVDRDTSSLPNEF